MPVTFPRSSSQNMSRSQQLLHRLQNSVIYPRQIYPVYPHTSSSLHSYMPSQLNLPKAPNSDLPEKLPETSSSKAAPPSTRFTREETRLLVSVWEEEFVGFTCKKKSKTRRLEASFDGLQRKSLVLFIFVKDCSTIGKQNKEFKGSIQETEGQLT